MKMYLVFKVTFSRSGKSSEMASLIPDAVCRKGVSERGIEFLTCSTSNQDPLCCQSISFARLHNKVAELQIRSVWENLLPLLLQLAISLSTVLKGKTM